MLSKRVMTWGKDQKVFKKLWRYLWTNPFKVRDDYANLCMEDYATNKSFAEDLTEGKFSFPIVHAIKYVFFLQYS